MGRIYDDNSFSIGNTPLVRLKKVIADKNAKVLAKIEGRNPSYSVKCRIGASMIWDAENKGILKSGKEIIEPTSGNTGIALAFVGAARGYKVNLTMPDTMSLERRKILKILGANLILTDGAKGMKGAVDKAEELAKKYPDKYVLLQQFNNPANPKIHEETTGPEIWQDTNGEIDVLISGVGTGGTITGISRFIKNKMKKKIISVAVEPKESPVISQKLNGQALLPKPHKIQGIGAGFIPEVLDLSLVDRVEQVSDDDAIDYARRLATEEGILSGISCGAAVAAADRLSKLPEFKEKTFVVILPDSGERYLSSVLFKDYFDEK
ncbi:MAG: cysteine synthase A [Candidatus Omnitrophica bacterium]|nr:cysteine synthase A [Candidatus Omnitrophota bacterium]MDD5352970.1 cysteine synthase A [Candidatus Omnitrophota bacterium]MDD5550569.1 cysteine synthase A [Candidatus Omnitrophota bacterium]